MSDCNKEDLSDLKELFQARDDAIRVLINANDKNYNQRFDNILQATDAALASADRANTKAETATEKRFDAVNEFRATLADQQRNLMPRGEVEILIKGLNEKIDALNLATITRQSKDIGIREGIGTVVAITSVVSIAVSILFKFIVQ